MYNFTRPQRGQRGPVDAKVPAAFTARCLRHSLQGACGTHCMPMAETASLPAACGACHTHCIPMAETASLPAACGAAGIHCKKFTAFIFTQSLHGTRLRGGPRLTRVISEVAFCSPQQLGLVCQRLPVILYSLAICAIKKI